ncbi:MAG: molybdopterin-synthase adenylyltransferase MoeB [Chromatiaceae bacterium]|nr:molybdopterin-synthase adenylyltransferase MoeB [Chromatiaceae bacterium]MCP5423070.1 molybdopterin-synthase adenylyltransferase MoeB [Chromatiaceae bacterium]
MDDQTLLRYSRQILLPQIGVEGQQRLRGARALIVGIGGLGSPVAMYLAAAGVGTLELVDGDRVDLSNLQRQIVHATGRIGMSKTASAARTLHDLNPDVDIICTDRRLQGDDLDRAVKAADIVVDCSDNFATRFALNAACRQSRRPLVSGAAIRWDGQISVFDARDGGPCYRCLYPEQGNEDLLCSENGVVAPLVGIIGAMQALESVKLLCGIGESLGGRLLVLDGLRMQWRELRLRADPACPVCAQ